MFFFGGKPPSSWRFLETYYLERIPSNSHEMNIHVSAMFHNFPHDISDCFNPPFQKRTTVNYPFILHTHQLHLCFPGSFP
jgi:hypothetical protein